MPVVYMMHGFVGTGKTIFSKKLERETKAIRFSPDEWMLDLFGDIEDEKIFRDSENRILHLIWNLADQSIKAGNDVILDFGFWKKAERIDARNKIISMGAVPKLYALSCDEKIFVERVLARTERPNELRIDANAIEVFKARFEPIEADEECISIDTSKGIE